MPHLASNRRELGQIKWQCLTDPRSLALLLLLLGSIGLESLMLLEGIDSLQQPGATARPGSRFEHMVAERL